MSDSLIQIYIHAVWATKKREPFILPELKAPLFKHIEQELDKMNCQLLIINSMPDHIHCLFSICSTKSISYIIKQIKGSSSRFINLQYSLPTKLEWQIGYAAFSVSKVALNKVYNYIKYQDVRHGFKSMADK
ncbi:IS200/IS605 family transposase [Aquirufa ecclesiirivi]|uniref:IS200/IS605 family transposase n=1 Tax=Aquirufa ecclesiirivi TaxID=2715124 RepID=A0ABT4JJ27_9BACT|nr:IS200/IS605 family transposase [Aquirufa ecclesiirivi]MCZ2476284.1 IS200/IS605 family transposase [Aquirufa ecclesiirivi]